MPRRRHLRQLGAGALGCAFGLPARAQSQRDGELAVLYPEVEEPYRSFFLKILDGIDDRFKGRIQRLQVPSNPNVAALVAELRRREVRVVIALGRAGLRVASALEHGVEVIGGGVVNVGESEARDSLVLSLAPDPALLLRRLRALRPGVKTVTVAYSQANSAWLMGMAREAARSLGLELRSQLVADNKSALQCYQTFFAQATPQDALWLLQDTVALNDSTMLPLILEECWSRNLVLFSSNSGHVGRGALFSLFANNTALGRSLAALAQARLASDGAAQRGMLPMRDVFGALNTRTASHLGIELTPQLRQGYELLLPERLA